MCEIKWLHISDLHQTTTGNDWLWPEFEKALHDDLGRLYEKAGPWDLVFFTGDLVRTGAAEEYHKLDEALDRLWGQFLLLGGHKPVLVSVPGNHDLLRPAAAPAVPKVLHEEFWSDPNHSLRQSIAEAFGNYSAWWSRQAKSGRGLTDAQPGILPGDFSATIKKKDVQLGLVGLNTAALQLRGGNFKHRLTVHPKQLMAICGGDRFVRWFEEDHHGSLLLTHHPPSWFDQAGRKAYEVIARPGRFVAHLFGHRHEAEALAVRAAGGSGRLFIQAPSLFGLRTFGSARQRRAHGFLFGQTSLRAAAPSLRLFPRRLSMQGNVVPDHDSFFLVTDGGTDNLVFVAGVTGGTVSTAKVRTSSAPTPPAPTEEVDNPYDYVHPATGKRFFGRKAEVAKFLAALQNGRSVAVFGIQRIGKTSLAREVLDVLLPGQKKAPIVFRIDMFRSADTLATYFDFFETLYQQLRDNVGIQVQASQDDLRSFLRSHSETRQQQDGLRQLLRVLAGSGRSVILFIDEFQDIERAFELAKARATRTDPIDSGFVRFLSSLIKDSRMNLQLVISGRYRVVELDREKKFELLKLMEPIHLTHLEDPPASALITQPAKGRLTFEKGAVSRLLALAGRNAYLINMLCSQVCDELPATSSDRMVRAAEVDALSERLTDDPMQEAKLGVLYEDFLVLADGRPMDALLALAASSPAAGPGQSRSALVEYLHERGIPEVDAKETIAVGLRELAQARLIVSDGEQRFTIVPDIIRMWLRRRHVPVWSPRRHWLHSTA